MIQNSALEAHPYYQKFLYQLRSRMQFWSGNGAITPQEFNLMCIMAQNPGQQTVGFLQGLLANYPNGITEAQMTEAIDNQFLPAMRQAARQRLSVGTGMMGMGMSGMGLGGMGMGGVMTNMGMSGIQTRPSPMASFASPRSLAAGLYGEMVNQPPAQPKQEEAKPEPVKPKTETVPWKCPEFDNNFSTSKFMVSNCVNVVFGKFDLHDSKTCVRMLICDPRLRYTCDLDAVNAFRPYFSSFKNDHKFVTIQYKQLKTIPVGREEMLRLSNEVALAVSKIDTGLVDKLKTIATITRGSRYSFACAEAYTNLFCDEFDLHMQCGELTIESNPKMVLNRFKTISEIVNFVAKDIDKSTVQALEGIPDYYKTLNRIVEDIVYDLALNFSKKIVDPSKHLALLGSYMRAVPPIWSTDTDLTMRGTDDLIELWVMSNAQISGSKTDGAVSAGAALKQKIEELDKQFTVFWQWRTVTWTDYPASSSVAYSETGECYPTVWNLNNPKSDVTFFIGEYMKATESGNDAAKKRSPRSIYLEFEESTCVLNYGWTVDAKLWLGCSKYWK